MGKYSISLVIDYINGNDIEDYDIAELEDDMEFMMMVFDACNDKKMYLYVGDKLRKNIDFIKYLINKFYKDKDFVINITNEYMENATELKELELKILICDYLDDVDLPELMKYNIDVELFYVKQRLICQTFISDFSEIIYKNMNTLGFDIILEEFESSKIIKDFFAKKMISEIFNFSTVKFEKFLHSKFKNKNSFLNMGVNNFLINYIYLQDEMLAGYASVHVSLLSDLNKKINKFLNRWDDYEYMYNMEKIEIIFEEMDKFVFENICFLGYELEIFKYIIDKFNLKKEFLDSKIGLKHFDSEFNGNLDDIGRFDITKFDILAYGKFLKFINIIESVCNLGVVPDNYLEDIKPKRKGKIIRLQKKNSN